MVSLAAVFGQAGVITAGILYGFGYGGFYSLLNVAAVEKTDATNRGVANSIFFGSKDIGTACGALAWGTMTLLGYPVMYGVAAAVICLLTVFYLLRLKKIGR